jgi:uracil phosphoribosyltransferase
VLKLDSQPVLATILRAGLPLHQGLLNYFDAADNAFISAYRMNHKDNGTFDVRVEYLSSPLVEGRVVYFQIPCWPPACLWFWLIKRCFEKELLSICIS